MAAQFNEAVEPGAMFGTNRRNIRNADRVEALGFSARPNRLGLDAAGESHIRL